MKIGYRFDHYPILRNIKDIVPGVNYQVVNDFFSRLRVIALKVNRFAGQEIISTKNLSFQFNDFNLHNVDVIHFFNTVSYGKTPWVTSFETILPRFTDTINYNQISENNEPKKFNLLTRRAVKAMAGEACIRIIALSECTANIERAFFANFKEYQDAIDKKLIVLHPPQETLVNDFMEKNINLVGPIKFLFVGNGFFRKGGKEIVDTFLAIKKEYDYRFELIIVSSFVMDKYAAQETVKDIQEMKELMAENSSWIKHFQNLPHTEVLDLMKEAHVGLLPTYADTYGYSVLEFQATGCPVISTNVRALPEINNNEVGWLIKVLKNSLGEALYSTSIEREILSKTIVEGLEKALHEIFGNRELIIQKSNKAIKRIQEQHDLHQFGEKLKTIYQDTGIR